MSPSSTPRLPSPPPLSEDFIHPKSPSFMTVRRDKLEDASKNDHSVSRRIRPGTKAGDMAEGPPPADLTEIDSAFQLLEYLESLHNAAVHPDGSTTSTPIDRSTALTLAHPPDGVDRTAWLYELCRFLCQKVNSILIALFDDHPPCSSLTCPEMRASEWQYLCAVHDPPKSCCAIDYCCHTLDWAATTLTSPKNFPSRLALGADSTTQHQQARQLTNVFRRVYRILAHAWFQHRDVFWKVEGQSGLYVLFKTVCDVYQLIPEDNYTIPPEAEGLGTDQSEPERKAAPKIMQREAAEGKGEGEGESGDKPEMHGLDVASAGKTTRKHRHSPSTGATTVDTVIEELEEDEDEDGAEDDLSRADTLKEESPKPPEEPSEHPVGHQIGVSPEHLNMDPEPQPESQTEPELEPATLEAEEPLAVPGDEEDAPIIVVEEASPEPPADTEPVEDVSETSAPVAALETTVDVEVKTPADDPASGAESEEAAVVVKDEGVS